MSILIKPIITEKATRENELLRRYGFIVNSNANKLQIKKAVEDTYNVHVNDVRTMNYPYERSVKYTKKGVVAGKTGGYKKAIIQLAEGNTIDFYNKL
jgi:large subunit ribosomal protein L23